MSSKKLSLPNKFVAEVACFQDQVMFSIKKSLRLLWVNPVVNKKILRICVCVCVKLRYLCFLWNGAFFLDILNRALLDVVVIRPITRFASDEDDEEDIGNYLEHSNLTVT